MNGQLIEVKRFFVDERVGCIAVRDIEETNLDFQGLHEKTPGVVWFRHGKKKQKKCPTCGHESFDCWEVQPELILEAKQLAEKLNTQKD